MLNFYLGQHILGPRNPFKVGGDWSDIIEVSSFCSRFFHFFPSLIIHLSLSVLKCFHLLFQNLSKKIKNYHLVRAWNK